MAADDRKPAVAVIDRLLEEPYRFDFYQAVLILERAVARERSLALVGAGVYPDHEAVRFESSVRAGFPASSIDALTPPDANGAYGMRVNFLGLAGAHGPLPAPLSDTVIARSRRRDFGPRDFLDIFNHRLVSLMMRGRRKHRFTLLPTRPEETPFARYLFSLFGLGTEGLRDRLGVSDHTLLAYTGLLAQQPRSVDGLERVLSHCFSVPVSIRNLIGGWHWLEADQTTVIGLQGRNNVLGRRTVLGERVWSQSSRFEVRLGPLDLRSLGRFLPIGGAFKALCALTRFYVGPGVNFQVRILLRERQAPAARTVLSKPRAAALTASQPVASESPQPAYYREIPQRPIGRFSGPRLGWTSFLSLGRTWEPDGEIVLRPYVHEVLPMAHFHYEGGQFRLDLPPRDRWHGRNLLLRFRGPRALSPVRLEAWVNSAVIASSTRLAMVHRSGGYGVSRRHVPWEDALHITYPGDGVLFEIGLDEPYVEPGEPLVIEPFERETAGAGSRPVAVSAYSLHRRH